MKKYLRYISASVIYFSVSKGLCMTSDDFDIHDKKSTSATAAQSITDAAKDCTEDMKKGWAQGAAGGASGGFIGSALDGIYTGATAGINCVSQQLSNFTINEQKDSK